MSERAIVEELVAAVTAGDLFTDAEARSLIKSVVSPTPDELAPMLERVILWARRVRHMAAIVDTIVQMDGNVEVIMADGADSPSLRLRPGMDVEILDDELGLERVRFRT